MNNNVHSALHGTETQKNLTDAFSSEARSYLRYRIFADMAEKNGERVLSRLLKDLSDNEREHAELWLGYLGEAGTDAENLEALAASEEYESTAMYPELAAKAADEGFGEIAEKLRYAANAEAGHAKTLSDFLSAMKDGSMYHGEEDTLWICTNCGYEHIGPSAPERCPLCSHTQKHYVKG